MKIIGIVNNYPQHDNKTEETNKTTAHPVLFTKTDATILKDGKPFFVPDNMGLYGYRHAKATSKRGSTLGLSKKL